MASLARSGQGPHAADSSQAADVGALPCARHRVIGGEIPKNTRSRAPMPRPQKAGLSPGSSRRLWRLQVPEPHLLLRPGHLLQPLTKKPRRVPQNPKLLPTLWRERVLAQIGQGALHPLLHRGVTLQILGLPRRRRGEQLDLFLRLRRGKCGIPQFLIRVALVIPDQGKKLVLEMHKRGWRPRRPPPGATRPGTVPAIHAAEWRADRR